MLHNVYNMSTASTPSRSRPALVIPSIDSRGHFDGSKASMLCCGGLPTPPQSALESRRPSLQFSAMNEYASSVGSTMGGFLQPDTPVRGASRHGESYNQHWAEHAATTNNTPHHLPSNVTASHMSQPMLQPAFQAKQSYHHAGLDEMDVYVAPAVSHHADSFVHAVDGPDHGIWSSLQYGQQPLAAESSTSLAPPLFAMSQALENEHNTHDPLGIQAASQYHTQSFEPQVGGFQPYGANHIYGQPQVVVPSQLSPHDDWSQPQYHAFTSPGHGVESYPTSFASSTGSLDDYEVVRPPSPYSNYFAQSDEEEYVHVKFERANSPSYNASLRRSASTRPRRRGSRRTRAAAQPYTYKHHIGITEVICENFDPKNGRPTPSTGKPKLHRCTHIMDDGKQCVSRFQRQEHLKRHLTSHSAERKFPCPLKNCKTHATGGIGRPDNAADHFKTHLRPPRPGARNAHFDWPEVRHAIATYYEDKKRANKLLDNLQKWIDQGMPESVSQSRGTKSSSFPSIHDDASTMCNASEYSEY